MKRAKRLLSKLLVLCLVLGLLPASALAADSQLPFTDVPNTAWYKDAVQYVYELGIMSGTSETSFSPSSSISRGQFVTILHRLEGTPSAPEAGFTDVPSGKYYANAVAWASANNIVTGYNNGTFGPDNVITRQQFAAILYRYAQYKGYDTTASANIASFQDSGQVSSYAVDALSWAIGAGLISGTSNTTLTPNGNATRAQAAVILMRYCINIVDANTAQETNPETTAPTSSSSRSSSSRKHTSGSSSSGGNSGSSGSDSDSDGGTVPKPGPIPEPTPTPDGHFTVIFDSNGGTEVKSQTVSNGEYAQEPEMPTRSYYTFVGWYTEPKDITEAFDINDNFDFQRTPITDNTILYAVWIGLNDTDGDGLTDDLELYYGTSINNQDSDGDGLSDYIEIVILGTDPLSQETNGISDADADSDGDGLSNIEEVHLGTDPGDKDTDADGLLDGEESKHGANPIKYDTDGDGVSDGTEVKLGTRPDIPDIDFDLEVECDVGDTVVPSVEVTLDGEQVETLSVSPVFDSYLFPEDMPGYMGKAYSFSVDGTINSATISFEFDDAALPADADPCIFYFNEEYQTLEECETDVVDNVASTEVDHFSTYVLIDRNSYYNSFQWEDVWDTEGSPYTDIEIVFVVDDSGSMDWNDPYYERLSVARTLIDNLPDGSKIGLVRFDGSWSTNALTPTLTTDKEAVKDYLTRDYFYSPGGTDMYNGIQKAFPLYESAEETTLKMMIVLSDGETDDTYLHDSVISEAKAANIKIYTVGLGVDSEYYFNNYLKPLAAETDAEFYLAADASELADIYKDINKKIDIETDSDGDGIPDYYEDHMVSFNGMPIRLDKMEKDTDGDGLEDGEEVVIDLVYNEDRTKVYIKGKLLSYPDRVDSDNDGIEDADDPKPMEYTITDRTLAFVEGLSYTNLHSYVGKTVGYALDHGAALKGISPQYAEYLRDAVIICANDSAVGYWKDFWDSGLGSVALKFTTKSRSSVVYALRGTEFDSDFANDTTADVILGLGWDCEQSRNAFAEYKSFATDKNCDYYVTGHSLGGRLAQDVLYKIYNANEGGLFKKKADIPTPVHSATFNALGYNKLVYITLENDVLGSYKNKLTNYYYWLDLVGEGFGSSGVYTRAGTDVELLCKDIRGNYYRDKEFNNWVNFRDSDYHGINYFQNDYDLLYTSRHDFSYWAK